jgi:hypothetical protein
VCLYLFSFQPNESRSEVFRLAESLKKAHDAGIKVDVVLDQNIDFVGEEGASVAAKNLKDRKLFDGNFTLPIRSESGIV